MANSVIPSLKLVPARKPSPSGVAAALAAAFGGPAPEVTGKYRLGDVRHVVASPAAAAADDGLGFRAQTPFAAGMAEFAKAPLRRPVTGGLAA